MSGRVRAARPVEIPYQNGFQFCVVHVPMNRSHDDSSLSPYSITRGAKTPMHIGRPKTKQKISFRTARAGRYAPQGAPRTRGQESRDSSVLQDRNNKSVASYATVHVHSRLSMSPLRSSGPLGGCIVHPQAPALDPSQNPARDARRWVSGRLPEDRVCPRPMHCPSSKRDGNGVIIIVNRCSQHAVCAGSSVRSHCISER